MYSFDLAHKLYAMWQEMHRGDVDNFQTTNYTFKAMASGENERVQYSVGKLNGDAQELVCWVPCQQT